MSDHVCDECGAALGVSGNCSAENLHRSGWRRCEACSRYDGTCEVCGGDDLVPYAPKWEEGDEITMETQAADIVSQTRVLVAIGHDEGNYGTTWVTLEAHGQLAEVLNEHQFRDRWYPFAGLFFRPEDMPSAIGLHVWEGQVQCVEEISDYDPSNNDPLHPAYSVDDILRDEFFVVAPVGSGTWRKPTAADRWEVLEAKDASDDE